MTVPRTIRAVVVDDYGLVRDGLRLLLGAEEGIDVVGAAATLEEAAEVVAEEVPDVVILDLVMAGHMTLEAIARLRNAAPDAAILVLAAVADPECAREAFAAGALGYLLKEATREKLLDAVRDVVVGTRYLDPQVGARLALVSHQTPDGDLDTLAEREVEVLRLLALGYTTQDVAAMVARSPRTIELYRAKIMSRLGLARRPDLVRYALSHGLLDDARPGDPADAPTR